MKNICTYLMILAAAVLNTSCNNEWETEQYEQYISFKAPVGGNADGVTSIYVRYKGDGKVTYQVPVLVSGSTVNQKNIDVRVAVDRDTLEILNWERFSTRTELYYKPLDTDKYEFPETVSIQSGSCAELLNIDFKLKDIDMVNKWVLPLTIVDDPSYNYTSNPRKDYAKALLRVIPFNDYSGSYSTSTMEVYIRNENGTIEKNPMTTSTRTAFVVDDNTVFFYAGLMGEELEERATYKIYVRFNKEDETIDMWSANPDNPIKFNLYDKPAFSVTEIMDATRPYLLHRYVSFTIEYDFQDITSAPVPILYKVKGTLMLERNFNTQIPEGDQQIEW